MRILTPGAFALVCLISTTASAAANFVHHEQTNNYVATPADDPGVGCSGGGTNTACGRYVENTDRSGSPGFQVYAPETYGLHFKVEFQSSTNQARVYYTTDGTNPSGSYGTGFGTTRVVTASYGCAYSDVTHGCQMVDVVSASIPPQAAGTTVKYIVSAWHDGLVGPPSGGPEVFADSGTCLGCFSCTDSTTGCATVFQYSGVAPPATPLIISEFRLRGPGADGVVPSADDASDEFVEIYNNGNSDVTVNSYDGSAGFALVASDGVTRFTIPNGTVIPARGHYLGVNSVGYSLGPNPAVTRPSAGGGAGARGAPTFGVDDAPSGKSRLRAKAARTSGGPAAGGSADAGPGLSGVTGDVSYTTQIADNAGFALFNTANPANFSPATRLDAVGSTSELNTLFKEGDGYPAIVPLNIDYSFYRDLCGKGGSTSVGGPCPTVGFPKDTGDNASDFLFVDTSGADAGAGRRLGAPGPENSAAPVQRNGLMPVTLIFPCVATAAPPNRTRSFTPDPSNDSLFGTLTIRRRVTNNTGANVTRLRFRVMDISTSPAPPGTADLRARTSTAEVVANPCTSLPVTVQGTTLEEPPTQSSGGGFNSSLSAGTVTLLTPIAPGGTLDFQFLLGVQQTGAFKFFVNVEVLP
ncbi:MAG TPA: lamin tail domain-containing protein [Pyrinomonadaceae bacterium]|nr:lamin tail domain-containing protein [Pyrinomonadaceae bacterium]